jgi:hypothetical protein
MGWMVNATPRPLCPREIDPVPVLWEAGWARRQVWTGVENLGPTGILSPDRLARTDWGIPAHFMVLLHFFVSKSIFVLVYDALVIITQCLSRISSVLCREILHITHALYHRSDTGSGCFQYDVTSVTLGLIQMSVRFCDLLATQIFGNCAA